MPKKYIVQKKDTLPEIAFREKISEKSIVDATVAATGKDIYKDILRNPNILMEGMILTIPDKVVKAKDQHTKEDATYKKFEHAQYLRIQLDDQNGIIADIKLFFGTSKIEIYTIYDFGSKGKILIKSKKPLPLVSGINNASLELFLYSIKGVAAPWVKEKIELHIGELNPIIDVDTYWNDRYVSTDSKKAKIAIQKILVNLGYYKVGVNDVDAKINGVFDEFSEAAIASFQHDHDLDKGEYGKIDDETLWALASTQAIFMMGPQTIDSSKAVSKTYNQPLFRNSSIKAKKYHNAEANVLPFSEYVEHKKQTFNSGRPPAEKITDEIRIRRYPEHAFVAPCSESPNEYFSPGINMIGRLKQKFIFLDVGCWFRNRRDIGVIYGRHVYRCSYCKFEQFDEFNRKNKDHLDYRFFKGVQNVKVKEWAYAYWGAESEYDWEKIYVIIPDLHLMTHKIAEVWNPPPYTLDTELDLLEFSVKLNKVFSSDPSEVQVIQIGDSYDLWVGSGFASAERVKQYIDDLDDWDLSKSPNQVIGPLVAPFKLDPRIMPNPHAYLLDSLSLDNQDEIMLLVGKGLMYKLNKISPSASYIQRKLEQFKLVTNVIEEIKTMVKEIQGTGITEWVSKNIGVKEEMEKIVGRKDFREKCIENGKLLNPAEAALRLLDQISNKDMVYIYGNHDNYLIDPQVWNTEEGIKKRHATYETKKIYLEHGHRMEAAFAHEKAYILFGIPRNNDGVSSGFLATNVTYVKDNFKKKNWQIPQMWDFRFTKPVSAYGEFSEPTHAKDHDQPRYISQFAKLSIGRKATGNEVPHIMVIGHTHSPLLTYVDCIINY